MDGGYTICDRCGTEIMLDEANDGSELGWGELCNECYAEESFEREDSGRTEDGCISNDT